MKKAILRIYVMILCLAALCMAVNAQTNPYGYTEGAVLYSETFESAGSLTTNFAQSGTGTYTIEWLDYTGKATYGGAGTASGGCEDLSGTTFVASNIPSAPNTSDASTKAIRMYVNPTGFPASRAVANLYTNTSFSGNYRVKVDMFYRVNGPPDYGGTGSTEDGLVGVGHSGTKINNQQQAGDLINPVDTDGYFFVMNNERGTGSTGDCVLFEGTAAKDPAIYLVNVLACGAIDPATAVGSGFGLIDNNDYLNFFPYGVDKWRYRGSSGDGWITMIIDSLTVGTDRVTIIYLNNGTAFAEITSYADTDATYPSGKILMGYEDRFTSQNGPEDSYLIYDNLKVYQLDMPVTPTPTPTPLGASNWSLYE